MTSTATLDLGTAVPSSELVAVLAQFDGSGEDVERQLAAVGAWERVISWATARQGELLVRIDQEADVAQYGWHAADAARSLADEVGLHLGVSGGSAQRRVNTAATLAQKLPAVQEALRIGMVTTHHARLAVSGAAVLDEQVAQVVGAAVMADDGWRTPSQFAETFARIVHELDPEGAADRHREARRERRISHRAQPHGMGSLWALLPAEDSQAVYGCVDAHARSSLATNTPGDDRTLDQRRADALVELICGPTATTDTDTDTDGMTGTGSHRHGPRVNVTVAMSTLIGADDAPAHLAGYGWIDAATARRISADPTAVWHRLLTDPTSGRLLDYGRTTYRAPQDLRDFVTARDRTCVFPTCDRPAASCDLDHHDDWADGGTTCEKCLHSLCRRHHRLRHEDGWSYTRDHDTGDVWWIDPHGTIHHRPAVVLPQPEPVEPPRAPDPEPEAASEETPVDEADLIPPF